MTPRIGFFGAAQTVTGSRHLLEYDGKKVFVDFGMFQGSRELKEKNWDGFPVDPQEIDAVVVTHAHTDHIGMLPRLVAQGYTGPIYATHATIGLCRISLPDSGRLQEEDARFANKRGTRHQPALPLYTEQDAYACLKRFERQPYDTWFPLPGGAQCRFRPSGHILGSAMAEIAFKNGERILMSGDLGRYDSPIIRDPATVDGTDYLVLESTYGDRLHGNEDPLEKLEGVLKDAWKTGACVIVPSFAIGRTQELFYYLRQLQNQGRMPRIPVYLDSPMAVSVTKLYADSKEEHDEDMKLSIDMGRSDLEPDGVQFIRDREASKALNSTRGPMVIIAGSGMANGGRVLHHLMHRLDDPNTIVLFTGFQAGGTLGRRLVEGAPEVTIHRQEIPVRARIEQFTSLSAHADYGEILQWLSSFQTAPKTTFLVHGEPDAQASLKEKIEAQYGWKVEIPAYGDFFDLS